MVNIGARRLRRVGMVVAVFLVVAFFVVYKSMGKTSKDFLDCDKQAVNTTLDPAILAGSPQVDGVPQIVGKLGPGGKILPMSNHDQIDALLHVCMIDRGYIYRPKSMAICERDKLPGCYWPSLGRALSVL